MKILVLLLAFTFTACGSDDGSDEIPPTNNLSNRNNSDNMNNLGNNANNVNNANNLNNLNNLNNVANNANNENNTNNVDEPDCVPSEAAWETNARPFADEYCGDCHGPMPQFGAPMSLTDYADLVEGPVGTRVVDKMVTRLVNRTMPPQNAPQPNHSALDTLVEWASCGEQHADHESGLVASRPVFAAPPNPPEGLESFDVTASEFAVSPSTLDLYQCFIVKAPIEEPRLMRRIEPLIDDGRVLHHSLVRIDRNRDDDGSTFNCFGFPPGNDYVYVWGPGQEPLEFSDGGIRIEPGDHFVLQIHYNNGAGVEGVEDSSGFKVYHEPVGGTEYSLLEIGTLAFAPIGPGETSSGSGTCRVGSDVELLASWPHMHEIGSAFSQTVERADTGDIESIIELTGWSFEAQLIYDTPVSLKAGDVLQTTCTWDNFKDFTIGPGLGTADEMCFNFMYVTPPVRSLCD